MLPIYNWLVSSTFSSSLLIISLILIRKVFDGKIKGSLNVFLWFLLALDFIIPPIPRNVFCFPKLLLKGSFLGNFDNNLSFADDNIEFIMSNDLNTVFISGSKNSIFSGFYHFHIAMVLIWIIGIIAISILIMRRHLEAKSLILGSLVNIERDDFNISEIERNIGIKSSKLRYCWSSYIKSPMIYGIVKPIVILPSNIYGFLSKEEIALIITHEVFHYKRKDILILLIGDVLKVVFWYNPLVWIGFNMMRNDIEVACDMDVVKMIGYSNRKAYGMTIIKMIENHSKSSKLSLGIGFLNYKSQIIRRIKMMNFDKKKQNKYIVPFVVVLILTSFVFMTSADNGIENVSESNGSIVVDSSAIQDSTEEDDFKVIWPVPGFNRVSSDYGNHYNPVLKKDLIHTGIDIPARTSSNIIAAYDGKVILSEKLEGYGYTIILDHGNGYKTMYAHCESLSVEKDEKVKSGDTIAKVGSTGRSTGPHLHFEIRKNDQHVNPNDYLEDESN